MKNIFEETYTKIAELKKAYDVAKDEESREKQELHTTIC